MGEFHATVFRRVLQDTCERIFERDFCGTNLQENFAGKFCGRILRESFARHFWGKVWGRFFKEKFSILFCGICGTLLPESLTGDLLEFFAGEFYGIVLPDSWGSFAGHLCLRESFWYFWGKDFPQTFGKGFSEAFAREFCETLLRVNFRDSVAGIFCGNTITGHFAGELRESFTRQFSGEFCKTLAREFSKEIFAGQICKRILLVNFAEEFYGRVLRDTFEERFEGDFLRKNFQYSFAEFAGHFCRRV